MTFIAIMTHSIALTWGRLYCVCTCSYVRMYNSCMYVYVSRLTVVSREAKEEVPCDGLSTNAREYFTRTNLAKTKNTITYEP